VTFGSSEVRETPIQSAKIISRANGSNRPLAPGFMVRLSIRWSLLTSHLRGIKEVIIVASREPKKAPLLEVRVMYEPSRIAPACLVQAYERVMPLTRRAVASIRQGRQGSREKIKHTVGGSK
jgi:hypothetical protein